MIVKLKSVVQHFDNLAVERLLDREELDRLYRFETAVAAAKTENNHSSQKILKTLENI